MPKTAIRSKKRTTKRTSAHALARTAKAKASGRAASPKDQFLHAFDKEHATTVRLLRAFPADKLHIKPHSRSKSAKDLAWVFAAEEGMTERALTQGFDWTKPMPAAPQPPDSLDAIIAAYEAGHKRVADLVRKMPEAKLFETIQFPVAPKTIGDMPKLDFLWLLLCDQIHHRGQLSVYVRLADGKVPSIYGPTADEPWM